MCVHFSQKHRNTNRFFVCAYARLTPHATSGANPGRHCITHFPGLDTHTSCVCLASFLSELGPNMCPFSHKKHHTKTCLCSACMRALDPHVTSGSNPGYHYITHTSRMDAHTSCVCLASFLSVLGPNMCPFFTQKNTQNMLFFCVCARA